MALVDDVLKAAKSVLWRVNDFMSGKLTLAVDPVKHDDGSIGYDVRIVPIAAPMPQFAIAQEPEGVVKQGQPVIFRVVELPVTQAVEDKSCC